MNNIFKATEIDSSKKGWVVDLSPADCVNPDCYWFFSSKQKAERFQGFINDGLDASFAAFKTENEAA